MNREGFVRALFAMDAALERDGVAPLSKRWRKALTRWARRGTRRLVIRAGRQSGKSLTLCKLAVAMALYAGVVVPAATVAWAIFVSTSVSEATARLNTIATFLDKLGVPYERSGYELRMADQPLGFLVLACQHRTAVGRTAFAILCD